MRRIGLVVVAAILTTLIAAGNALADGPEGLPGVFPGDTLQYSQLPRSAAPSTTDQSANSGAPSAGSGTTVQPTAPQTAGSGMTVQPTAPNTVGTPSPTSKVTKRCTFSRRHKRGIRTCRYYAGHKLTETCVKKPQHRERCRLAVAAAEASAAARIAGTRVNSGFVSQPSGAVVRIYWTVTTPQGKQYTESCSGSVIRNGLILTAGHCVFSNKVDGYPESGFVNYYDTSTYTIVPGNTLSGGQRTAPYGRWTVKNMWTTQEYAYNDLGGDWGIIEVNADAQGRYPGDVVGHFAATWDYPTINELYSTGYPASYGFTQPQYGGGDLQFFCDSVPSSDDIYRDPARYGSDYVLKINPCEETGGASGGPVFARTSNGWTIVGVNNRGPTPASATSFGAYMMSFWFDDSFGTFWNQVLGLVQAGH